MAMNTRRCIYWEFGSEIVVYGKIDTPSFAHSVPNTSVLEKKIKNSNSNDGNCFGRKVIHSSILYPRLLKKFVHVS
jgi:hypothetical protein